MPTDKPRVNVTLEQTDFDLLTKLAQQQKRSRSDMLRDLFETMRPVLERVAVVTEAAQRAQATAKAGMIASAEKAEAELLPMVQAALGQFDMFIADVQNQASSVERAAGPEQPPEAALVPPTAPGTPVPVITGVRSSRTGGKTPRKGVRQGPSKVAARSARKTPRKPQRARR